MQGCIIILNKSSVILQFIQLFKGTSILDCFQPNLRTTKTESPLTDIPSRKQTRKIKVGWKYTDKNGKNTFVTAKKGGGINDIFMLKSSTLEELTKQFINLYFPNGHNKSMKLTTEDLKCSVATFRGDQEVTQ